MERKIVQARATGVSFSEMTNKQAKCAVDQIMFRGAALFGCPLPTTDFFAEIIGEELIICILDFGFARLTLEEIFLALRFNAKGGGVSTIEVSVDQIPFRGNCFNVSFISEVLTGYMRLRYVIDRKVQNHIEGY